jgi:mono/diheme cytochrome c family protein
MRRGAVAVLCLALVGAAGGGRALGQARSDPSAVVERGHYLTEAGECAGCHTRKGGEPFAGGNPLKTSLGTLVSANITPDAQTGIGSWTSDQFYRALHRGLDDRGRHLYPAMPYNYFTHVTREDSDAIFAYLRTVPAVSNAPQRNLLPFPLNIRGVMSFWNGLFFRPGEFTPDPAKSAEWNRGAYLVGGLSHCGGCHTQMNALGAPKTRQYLQGGTFADGFAPDLTPNPRTGLGGWSKQEIVDFLRTGRNAHANASAEMASVVAGSTSRLTDADLAAIATYLADLPPSPSAPVAAPSERTMRQGEAVYAANCAMCHQAQGQGGPRVVALRGDAKLQQANPVGILHVILAGVQRQASATSAPAAMPAFGMKLSDEDAAAVATYVRNAWGNSAPAASTSQVGALRRKLAAAATQAKAE